jgi:hypothetical protein
LLGRRARQAEATVGLAVVITLLLRSCLPVPPSFPQRVRHMNSIKSKSYRKIRKKQKVRQVEAERDRLRQEDPSAAARMDEADLLARARERMTLKCVWGLKACVCACVFVCVCVCVFV